MERYKIQIKKVLKGDINLPDSELFLSGSYLVLDEVNQLWFPKYYDAYRNPWKHRDRSNYSPVPHEIEIQYLLPFWEDRSENDRRP